MVSLVTGGALRGRTLSELVQRTQPPQVAPGTRLGAFTVERLIGQGGAGAVYLARREVGFEQAVALKLVHASSDWRARFEREEALLGRLSHPAIVRILDAGEADGVVWLAMEHVDGKPIDQHVAARGTGWRERLALLAGTCDALVHAHRELVVHGDLKPSNILVGAHGEPKLVDFGIATDLRAEAADADTGYTPGYASPEQAAGERLTTAADLYQCGRVLDALLLQDDTLALPTVVRDDIAAVVRRATQHDPAARYDSAAALAADLRAVAARDVVAARDGGRGYRARVFVRRHRVAVAAAAALVLALAGGLAASLWQARIARQYAADAVEHAHRARQTTDFVVSLLESGNVANSTSQVPVQMVDLLQEAARRIEVELHALPEAQAELRVAVGASLVSQGRVPDGVALLETGIAQLRTQDDTRTLASSLHHLAMVYMDVGRIDEAQAAVEESLRLFAAIGEPPGQETIGARTTLARIAGTRGDRATQGRLYREILADRRALYGDDDPRLAGDYNNLGTDALNDDRYADAERAYLDALRLLRKDPAIPELRQAWLHAGLGATYRNSGQLADAERELLAGIAIAERGNQAGHAILASLLNSLASLRRQQGQLDASEQLARRALGMLEPINNPSVYVSQLQLGLTLLAQGRDTEARDALQASIDRLHAISGERDPMLWLARAALALAQVKLGDPARVADIRDAAGALAERGDGTRRLRPVVAGMLAEALAVTGDGAGAEAARVAEHAGWRALLGDTHPYVLAPTPRQGR